jgi:hypothetical protein
MSGGATLYRKSTKSAGKYSYRPPREAAIGPVEITCPSCATPLGFSVRVTLETARQAAKRPQLPEALVTCPSCHQLWVAGLWLSTALAVEEVTA